MSHTLTEIRKELSADNCMFTRDLFRIAAHALRDEPLDEDKAIYPLTADTKRYLAEWADRLVEFYKVK